MRMLRPIVAGLFAMYVGSTAWAASCDGFADVDSASGFCAAVSYVKDRGVTLGCTDASHYCPNDPVTRLQMAAFLQRMGQADPSNVLGDHTTTIGGGTDNTSASGSLGSSTVGGGMGNSATALRSTVSGGALNSATAQNSAVIGGINNTASGAASSVLGGADNTAAGEVSVALGFRARTTAAATGSFVFGDSTNFDVTSGAPNEFIVAASGGIRMLSDKSGLVGCSLAGGGGSWACSSSRDVKRDFEAINPGDVLARALALPVMRWRYVTEAPNVRHMGTFAQDFRAAFGLGSDDKSISMADADGVALAAIQGLNAKVEARDALIADQAHELAEQSHEIAEIKAKLAAMAVAH